MHAITATVLLLIVYALLGENSFAQEQIVPLKPRIGINPPAPETSVWSDNLKRFTVVHDSSSADNLLLQSDSLRFLAAAYGSALKAAEVDPGILIFPDPTVDAKILQVKPSENIDPKMILPRRGYWSGY